MNFFVTKYHQLLTFFILLFLLIGCTPYDKPLAIGAAPWPSFEFAFLANEMGYLEESDYSLLELTSSTTVIQAFQTGELDLAFLSLDEVLTLIALGVDLKIISVIDKSQGGDALVAKPEIKSLEALNLRSIGYENKAAGALILDEVLTLTGLNSQTVKLYEVKQHEVKEAYLKGNIDAFVVREPVKQELLALGANELINSNQLTIPNTNVLIAHADIVKAKQKQISYFLKQYYRAYDFYLGNPTEALNIISVRLQLYPYLLENAFLNTRFFHPKQALMRLSGSPSNIELQMQQLSKLMTKRGMLGQIHIDFSSIISTRTLERAIYE